MSWVEFGIGGVTCQISDGVVQIVLEKVAFWRPFLFLTQTFYDIFILSPVTSKPVVEFIRVNKNKSL